MTHQSLELVEDLPVPSKPGLIGEHSMSRFGGPVSAESRKTIWIDLDNSPHVPFFIPIIHAIQKRGHQVLLTARDSYQVCELLEFHQLSCKVIGGHWGKSKILKVTGTALRAARLLPLAISERPDLAMSIVLRSQLLVCNALHIPSIVLFDYEFVMKMQFLHPDWIFVPEVIPDSEVGFAKKGVLRYPGLKEDVYVPSFTRDMRLKEQLGIREKDLLVTVRPPATEAHYHNPESEELLRATLEMLTHRDDVRVVLLPRNTRQTAALQREWGDWIAKGNIIIPTQVVEGLNLIWCFELVVSGGGTMNREAAALGVPVYSIFRGKSGAVDGFLAANGRMVLLESVEDVQNRIVLARRPRSNPRASSPETYECALNAVLSLMEEPDRPASRSVHNRAPVHTV